MVSAETRQRVIGALLQDALTDEPLLNEEVVDIQPDELDCETIIFHLDDGREIKAVLTEEGTEFQFWFPETRRYAVVEQHHILGKGKLQ